MKQKLLSRLILGAIAGVAAAGVAQAGQIQASSVSIAREVITTDTQSIVAPSVAYRFAGDVDARVQAQTFQVQFTLGSGTFVAAPTAGSISLSDGVSGVIQDQSAAAPVGTDASYTVTNIGISADKKTIWASITVNQGATALIKQPIVGFNVTSNTIAGVAAVNVAAQRASVNGLFSVVGDLVADFNASGKCTDVKTAPVSFKHYVALTNPAAQADDTTATPDEHTRAGATNAATLMTFPTNVLVSLAASTGSTKVDVSAANLKFVGAASGTEPAYISTTLANLGTLTLKQNGLGYDSNLSDQYLLADVTTPGLVGAATATTVTGEVEVEKVDVVVSATNGFVTGANVFLATDALCAAPIAGSSVAVTAANAAGPLTLTVPTAAVNGSFGATGAGPVRVCYDVAAATTPIPLSAFTAVGTVDKANAGANLNEQNNVCNGNLYSLGGGIKIDVRNYANSKDPSGWQSVIRLINNNESRTVDVYGQLIQPDGLYGPWGKIATLAPRAVSNMTAAEIDALLVNAPAHGTAAYNGDSTAQSTATGARLRITSEQASSLRVQNYMYNPATGAVMEFSSSQGVDFEGTADRAAGEGQYISQDAEAGLNGK